MPRMIAFNVQNPKGDGVTSVYINPQNVRVLRPGAEKRTRIVFDTKHVLVVTEPIEVVRKTLDQAMNGAAG